jgi:D-proline reductase (dithiol) PrdB
VAQLRSVAVASDAIIRENPAVDVWEFGTTASAVAPPLEEARVAIVTTAGLVGPDGGVWTLGQGYVVHPGDRRDFRLAHASSNFDRSGFAADINVVYPVDRLHEMAVDGRIGSVAAQHISFMGAQPDHVLETLRLDTGPAAARILRNDGVDVVLLTPV